jgi:hypothetical protein
METLLSICRTARVSNPSRSPNTIQTFKVGVNDHLGGGMVTARY